MFQRIMIIGKWLMIVLALLVLLEPKMSLFSSARNLNWSPTTITTTIAISIVIVAIVFAILSTPMLLINQCPILILFKQKGYHLLHYHHCRHYLTQLNKNNLLILQIP